MVQVTDVLPLKENDDIAVVIVGLLRCIGQETHDQFIHYYICVRIQLNRSHLYPNQIITLNLFLMGNRRREKKCGNYF